MELLCPLRRICGTVITVVATWHCKCGVRATIVAERDLDKSTATVTVACSDCGVAQVIDADRMISITHEKDNDGAHSEQAIQAKGHQSKRYSRDKLPSSAD